MLTFTYYGNERNATLDITSSLWGGFGTARLLVKLTSQQANALVGKTPATDLGALSATASHWTYNEQ
jgi:hypothetical protein